MVRYHQPANGLSQRRVCQRRKRRLGGCVQAVTHQSARPSSVIGWCGFGQTGQPLRIRIRAHKSLKQAQRHPFVPIVVSLGLALTTQPILERLASLAKVV